MCFDPQPFILDATAQALEPFVRERFARWSYDASLKVRLKSDITNTTIGQPVIVQQTTYRAGLCTNEMIDTELWSEKTRQKIFVGFNLMSRDGVLLDFASSACSNHIGVSTLAITNDGKLIIPTQPSDSIYNAGLWAPSGSGSADWEDFAPFNNNFQHALTRAMERELREENGLESLQPQLKTRVIGMSRLLSRGGKPEFFGVSLLDLPAADLPARERLFVSLGRNGANWMQPDQMLQALATFQDQCQWDASFQLVLNLRFLQDYLAAFPGFFSGQSTQDD